MDKLKKYEKAVLELLKQHQFEPISNNVDALRDEIVVDKTNHHYQLVTVGWKDDRYFFNILFHLHIANNKIWLQQNNTEWRIADELISLGIDREDIVLGFVEPSLRQYSAFATA
jgi:hypothetical protein